VNCKLLGLKDLFERIKATNELDLGGVVIDATKYDVLPRVASRPMYGVGTIVIDWNTGADA
jgi:hypothetical protein